ncbi:MAG: hypothetical protein JNJ41_11915 [Bacteroidia bacterium]|nr:hypothetical protein [Bacteroidia bacterium]
MSIYLSKEPVMATSKYNEDAYILIFKTNIEHKKDLKLVELCMEEHGEVIDWHVDREDIDKVLRIESTNDITKKIIKTITQAGFFCEELN